MIDILHLDRQVLKKLEVINVIKVKDNYFTKEVLDNVLNKTKPGLKTVAHMKFLLFGTKVDRITFTSYDVERYKLDKLDIIDCQSRINIVPEFMNDLVISDIRFVNKEGGPRFDVIVEIWADNEIFRKLIGLYDMSCGNDKYSKRLNDAINQFHNEYDSFILKRRFGIRRNK